MNDDIVTFVVIRNGRVKSRGRTTRRTLDALSLMDGEEIIETADGKAGDLWDGSEFATPPPRPPAPNQEPADESRVLDDLLDTIEANDAELGRALRLVRGGF